MPDTTPLAAEAESSYTLGAGDQIRIDIFNVPEFSGNNGTYSVLVDGTLNLPWIGAVSVRGLTLTQSANLLTSRYARYINNPLLTVTLLNPRPLRIGVSGEVNRPGSYIVTPEGEGGAAPSQTVTQAIQTAGGITQIADVRRVQVRRPQLSGEEIINVDLWALLQAGDLSQDVRLRDGDTVIVPTATTITASEAPQLAVASFSPDTINVNVVGEVVSPGVVTVPPNTSLNQAILAAGGFDNRRARRGEVELIRLNPDGTAVRETLPVDFSAGLSAETNPALRNNDIVVVSRSGVTRTTDFLQTILAPLNPLTSIFGILRLFGIN
jgi:polysaccharide export outer membrane protein